MRRSQVPLFELGRDARAEFRQLRFVLRIRPPCRKRTHDRVLGEQRGRGDHAESLSSQQVIQLDERVLIRAAAVNRCRNGAGALSPIRPQPLCHQRRQPSAVNRSRSEHHIVLPKRMCLRVRPAKVDLLHPLCDLLREQQRRPACAARGAEMQYRDPVQHNDPSFSMLLFGISIAQSAPPFKSPCFPLYALLFMARCAAAAMSSAVRLYSFIRKSCGPTWPKRF